MGSTEYVEHRYQLRGIAVPTTRNRGTNYPESTGIKGGLESLLKRDELQPGLVQLSAEESAGPVVEAPAA